MPKKLYKILLVLGIAVVLILVILFLFYYNAPKILEVDFLDVGQGDSTLIKTPAGQNILIDGGPDNSVIRRLSENLGWFDKTIDLIILTHSHDDHITGLIDVIKRYKVNKILYTGAISDSPNCLAWLELARDKNVPMAIIDRLQIINLGENCKLNIVYPLKNLAGEDLKELNDSSIVSQLDCLDNKFLFMADAGAEIEKELIDSGNNIKSDIIKIAHHGSDTGTSQEFLEFVKPDKAVISVGENDFGHPSLRVIKRLERIGAQIFRTDQKGTIKLINGGVGLLVN